MKRRLTVIGLALGALLLAGGCVGSRRDLRPGRTELSDDLIAVPAQVIGNHFVVEAKWDKRGPWNFLVDTGSSVTLVSREFARRNASGKASAGAPLVRVTSADGNSTLLSGVTIRRIELAGAQFSNVQALVRDFDDISAHLGIKIDGVLAFSLFRNTVFTLDYPDSKLLIASAAESPPLPGATIRFNNDQRTPLIPIKVGETTLIALIDSGSDGPLLLNPSGLDLRFSTTPRPGTVVGTLTGNRPQEIGRLASTLTLGAYLFPEPIVELTDQLSALGGEILRQFAVTFDQSQNQVTFRRPERAPIAMAPRRSSGLAFSKGPIYWRVVGVVPGSPADEAGIKEGELVTRINGESVANWPLSRFEPFLKRNEEIVFTFLDGAKERPVVIPTFELVR